MSAILTPSAYFPADATGRLAMRAEDFTSPAVPAGFSTVWEFRAKWEPAVVSNTLNELDAEGLPLATLGDDDLTELYAAAYSERFGGKVVSVPAPPCLRALGIETVRAFETPFLLMGATAAWGSLINLEQPGEAGEERRRGVAQWLAAAC